MIPARLGSTRVKYKNIRYLKDKPLIEYIVDSAKKVKFFDEIYINSESRIFETIALKKKVKFYKRSAKLASGSATNDDFVLDFLKVNNCDYLIQLLPTSPFISTEEINDFIKFMIKNKFDTLISVKNIQIECLYKKKIH